MIEDRYNVLALGAKNRRDVLVGRDRPLLCVVPTRSASAVWSHITLPYPLGEALARPRSFGSRPRRPESARCEWAAAAPVASRQPQLVPELGAAIRLQDGHRGL